MPTIYGNSSQIVQGPGYVAIPYEMIHETRVIPLDAAPHLGEEHPIRLRRFARSLGRRHAGRETTNSSDRSVYRNANAERSRHRALHARWTEQGAMDGDGRRSHDVDEAVDILAAADTESSSR